MRERGAEVSSAPRGFAARARARSRETRFTHSNKRACSQATFIVSVETLRFQDENDYEYEIFSVLSNARALTSVILAGKKG